MDVCTGKVDFTVVVVVVVVVVAVVVVACVLKCQNRLL